LLLGASLLGSLALLGLLGCAVRGWLVLLCGPSALDLVLQAVGELTQDLLRDALLQSPAELGRTSGDMHVGLDAHPGAAAPFVMQRGGDGGRSRPLTPSILAISLEHRPPLGLVSLLDLHGAVVLLRDGPEPDLHRPLVLAVAVRPVRQGGTR
jgi:hypothetical protein